MGREQEIRRAIEKMSGRGGRTLWVGKVLVVDGARCTLEIEGMVVREVMLRPVDDGSSTGVLITPKTGSYVLAADLSYGRLERLTVVHVAEVEKIEVAGGEKGGLVNIQQLTDKLNELVQAFNSHTHTVSTAGTAAAQTGTAAPVMTKAQRFSAGDYEDDTITH